MKRLFIKKDSFVKLVLLSFIFLLILPVLYFLLWVLLVTLFLLLFRKNTISYKNSLSNTVDIVLSPVTGRVSEIIEDEDGKYIKVDMPIWGPYGLFLPYSAEISESRRFDGKKVWRGAKYMKVKDNAERFLVEFHNKLGHITSVNVMSCIVGGQPDIWLKAGDKGRSSACFGYLPFGGSVLVKVSKDSNILVTENEKVRAGFTILAGMKG